MKKRPLSLLGGVIVCVVLCFFSAEAVIRVHNFITLKKRRLYIPDSSLGFVHSANNLFRYTNDNPREYSVQHTTNSRGFLNKELKKTKDENDFRIFILGDSFTEALQVPRDENFVSQLEKNLSVFSDKRYEVINAGMSGASPIYYYLDYQLKIAPLQPDLVMVQLFANDVYEDNQYSHMSPLDESGLPQRIHYYLYPPQHQKSLLNHPLPASLHHFFLEASRFYEYLYTTLVKLNKNAPPNQEMRNQPQFSVVNQFFIIQEESPLFQDEDFREGALLNTARYLLALNQEIQNDGRQVLFFYIPSEKQLDLSHYSDHTRNYFSHKASRFLNGFLQKLFEENQIAFLDLTDTFEENKHRGLYFNSDGHLTAAGHKLVGQALRKFLRDKE